MRFLQFLLLWVVLPSVCHAEGPASTPTVVEAETKVRVACGWEPKIRLISKNLSSVEDVGAINQWTDFDVAFSLHDVSWDTSPKEFIQLVSDRIKRSYQTTFVSLCSVYRWNDAKHTYAFIGNKNFRQAKGFLHEIKDGDYIVFHVQYD